MPSLETTAYVGERVQAARVLAGISQTELANAIAVTPSLISHIESGRRAATEQLVKLVAQSTGNPLSFFVPVPADLPPVTLRFRKLSRTRVTDSRRVEQLLREAYRVVWQLVNARQGFIPPSLPIATQSRLSEEDIESLAARTRETLGLDSTSPIRNVTRSLERVGAVVAPLAFAGDEGDEFETVGHFGASGWPGDPEPAVIGYFEGGAGDRQRFTLGHELGHLVLHSRRRVAAGAEDEANRFAGAFLIPSSSAQEFVSSDTTLRDFAHLKAAWGVSIQALIMRCSQLGLIDPARKASLFKQLSARGWRRREPVNVQHESPVLLRKLLEAQFGTEKNLYQRAEDRLGLSAFTLAKLAGSQRPRSGDDVTRPKTNDSASIYDFR